MQLRAITPVLAVSAAFVLAGCGGSGGGGGGEPDHDDVTACDRRPRLPGAEVIPVHENEFSLTPAMIKIDRFGYYGIKAVNDGKVAHALTIEGTGSTRSPETSHRAVENLPRVLPEGRHGSQALPHRRAWGEGHEGGGQGPLTSGGTTPWGVFPRSGHRKRRRHPDRGQFTPPPAHEIPTRTVRRAPPSPQSAAAFLPPRASHEGSSRSWLRRLSSACSPPRALSAWEQPAQWRRTRESITPTQAAHGPSSATLRLQLRATGLTNEVRALTGGTPARAALAEQGCSCSIPRLVALSKTRQTAMIGLLAEDASAVRRLILPRSTRSTLRASPRSTRRDANPAQGRSRVCIATTSAVAPTSISTSSRPPRGKVFTLYGARAVAVRLTFARLKPDRRWPCAAMRSVPPCSRRRPGRRARTLAHAPRLGPSASP